MKKQIMTFILTVVMALGICGAVSLSLIHILTQHHKPLPSIDKIHL